MSDDALIEAMVRAIFEEDVVDCGDWDGHGVRPRIDETELKTALTAALAAIRKTHAVVPRELLERLAHGGIVVQAAARSEARAMLSAGENHDGQ